MKINNSKESQNVEWKLTWRDEYLKWICGFANALGGRIIIGKDNSGKVIGLSNADKFIEELPNKIRDKLGLMPQVNLLNKYRKYYIEIIVKTSSVPVSLHGVYYWRSGSTKQELKGQSLTEFLLKKMGLTWDRVIEENATIEDIDESSIEIFKKDARIAGRLPDLNRLSVREVLMKLRLLTRDGLTRAALVLFGKDPGEFYPNLFLKIGRFGLSDVDIRFQEVCEGNLFMMLKDVMEQLEKKFLIKPVRFEGLQRIEELEYPVEALREMLLNSLVHRNYLGSMTQMKVYDNQLTLWNSGVLPDELTIEQLFKTHESIPRNPLIAEVCYKAGYIDSWGRGVEKITEACREFKLPDPRIFERSGGIVVELQKMSVKMSVKVSVKMSVKTQNQIISILAEKPKMTLEELAENIGKSVRTVERITAKLKKEGELRYFGSQKGGHWEVLKNGQTTVETRDAIIATLKDQPGLTLGEVAAIIGKSSRTVERIISKLKKEGKLNYFGPQKGGYWEIYDE